MSVPVEKRCEGGCGVHYGIVRTVHVSAPDGYPFGEFDYCEEAVVTDRRTGFVVTAVDANDEGATHEG